MCYRRRSSTPLRTTTTPACRWGTLCCDLQLAASATLNVHQTPGACLCGTATIFSQHLPGSTRIDSQSHVSNAHSSRSGHGVPPGSTCRGHNVARPHFRVCVLSCLRRCWLSCQPSSCPSLSWLECTAPTLTSGSQRCGQQRRSTKQSMFWSLFPCEAHVLPLLALYSLYRIPYLWPTWCCYSHSYSCVTLISHEPCWLLAFISGVLGLLPNHVIK